MFRQAFQWLSPAGPSARLCVLILHRVKAVPDPLFPDEIDARQFDAICSWLARWFTVLPLDVAVMALSNGSLPARAAAITFDDGYADNCEVALPILQQHGLPATFFIATGFVDGGRMWNDTVIEAVRGAPGDTFDLAGTACESVGRLPIGSAGQRRKAIDRLLMVVKYLPPEQRLFVVDGIARASGSAMPDDLMLTSDQVRDLYGAGMQIGAHTVNHPILAGLPAEHALWEMKTSKHQLEAMIDHSVSLFAYPNGKPGQDYSAESVTLVRQAGFTAAVSTQPAIAGCGIDLWQIPRFTPWDRSRIRFGGRLVRQYLA